MAAATRFFMSTRRGVLTLASGGCARYAFSTDVTYCLDRRGHPLILYASGNPHHHLIMTNSSVELRLIYQLDRDGQEEQIMLLIGMLRMVDPGDHDSLDRHARYFGQPIENYTRGNNRLYRLEPEHVLIEHISGARTPLPLHDVVRRNMLKKSAEMEAIRKAQLHVPAQILGVDALGMDGHDGRRMVRWHFTRPLTAGSDMNERLHEIGEADAVIS